MSDISVDVWLYGPLARYGKEADQGSFANLSMGLPEGSTMADLLRHLGMHDDERGITFINGQLSAMPGLKPDLDHILNNGDRVGIFHPQSMWPFQYRHGVKMTDEMTRVVTTGKNSSLHHTYEHE
jgi:sulfur carrier protein ThiS